MANDNIEPIFRSKEAMVQFQAADLLAWKNRKVLAEAVNYKGPGDMNLYNSIEASMAEISRIPHKYGVHSYRSIELVAQHGNIPKR